jgi:hypothetical protein
VGALLFFVQWDLAFFIEKGYNYYMDIQSLSVNMGQTRVQEQAAVQVQAMSLDMMKEQAAEVEKLLSSVHTITDPNLGQNINLLA